MTETINVKIGNTVIGTGDFMPILRLKVSKDGSEIYDMQSTDFDSPQNSDSEKYWESRLPSGKSLLACPIRIGVLVKRIEPFVKEIQDTRDGQGNVTPQALPAIAQINQVFESLTYDDWALDMCAQIDPNCHT